MPPNVNGLTGVGAERSTTGAENLQEIRQRQAERLRVAGAESSTTTEVVEGVGKKDEALNDSERPETPLYRVNLNPDTGRLMTEVLDKTTGDVILRIPPEYLATRSDGKTSGDDES